MADARGSLGAYQRGQLAKSEVRSAPFATRARYRPGASLLFLNAANPG